MVIFRSWDRKEEMVVSGFFNVLRDHRDTLTLSQARLFIPTSRGSENNNKLATILKSGLPGISKETKHVEVRLSEYFNHSHHRHKNLYYCIK